MIVDNDLGKMFERLVAQYTEQARQEGIRIGYNMALTDMRKSLNGLKPLNDVQTLETSANLSELGLTSRTLSALTGSRGPGCRLIRDVIGLTDAELLDIDGFGPSSLRDLDRKLAMHGLRRGQPIEPEDTDTDPAQQAPPDFTG